MSGIRTFTLAAFAAGALAVSAGAQGTTVTPRPNQPSAGVARHGKHAGRMGEFANLNLTDAQKSQIKAIHQKYQTQFWSKQDEARPLLRAAQTARVNGDTATARADMEKARQIMQATASLRQQERTEVQSVLTADQRAKLDADRKQFENQRGARGGRGGRGFRGPGGPGGRRGGRAGDISGS